MEKDMFVDIVSYANQRSMRLLEAKEEEYSGNSDDRLTQFKMAAAAQGINPASALIGMMTKHYTSICAMVKAPEKYNDVRWDEKLIDLRNYTYLLEGVLIDMGIMPIVNEVE